MKLIFTFCFLVMLTSLGLFGQDKPSLVAKDSDTVVPSGVIVKSAAVKAPERRWGDAGFGVGLDYGGLPGVKATFYPVKHMGIFAGAGYELFGIGWNVGILGRAVPADGKHGARPYLKLMYGVNGATMVRGKGGYDKMFLGLTAGIGLEARFGKAKKHGLNIDLNVPFRSQEFFSQVKRIKDDPQLTSSKVLPIAFSIGYQVEF